MSKQYIKEFTNSNQESNYHMWVRIGAVDGLRYLSRHFQIVIFNRDTCVEDLGQDFSQVQLIQQYFNQCDANIDAIYSAQTWDSIKQNLQADSDTADKAKKTQGF